MATPTNVTFASPAGVACYMGRVRDLLVIVQDGDSLSTHEYRADPARHGLGATLHPPMVVATMAVSAQNIRDMINRQAATIAVADAAGADAIMVLAGTNGEGSGGTFAQNAAEWVDGFIAAGYPVIVRQCPPKAGAGSAILSRNADWVTVCNARPADTWYIEEGTVIGDAGMEPLAGMMVDGIHHSPLGQYTSGVAQAARFNALGLFTGERRLLDPADTYELNPASTQYVRNPHMAGSGTPTHWTVGASGGATVSSSIVAADVGDPVQVPWLQAEFLTASGDGQSIQIAAALKHPALSADLNAGCRRLDCVLELKTVNLNCTNLKEMTFACYASSVALSSLHRPGLTGIGTAVNMHRVLRNSYERAATAHAADSVSLILSVIAEAAFGSTVGSIKVRIGSVRAVAV